MFNQEPEITTTAASIVENHKGCFSCHADASCQHHKESNGECCACNEGFIGNGKFCIPKATPVSVVGKITGVLNGERLEELDLYAYVLTQVSDSRNFVIIRKIPTHLGGSFQSLISIVNPIGWLFAGLNGNGNHGSNEVVNGFTITGGLFTRMLRLSFYDEAMRHSHTVTIRQEFLGMNSNTRELTVNTLIDGSLPNIDIDSQVLKLIIIH